MPRQTKAQRLARDARNRALRTFLQGLGIDILVAVSMLVYDALNDDQPNYRLLLATAAKTVLQTIAAYLMRLKLDPSRVPTPLPPDPPGEPNDDEPGDAGHADAGGLLYLAVGLVVLLVILRVFHLI